MSEIARLLIIDHDPDARYQMRRLAGASGLDACGQTGLGTEAIALAAELVPQVILCGLKEPVVRVQQTIESLTHTLPDVPVIVYSDLDDLEVVRKAMLSGARDFLRTPFKPGQLLASVQAAVASQERRRSRQNGEGGLGPKGSIITVFGAKGGIGKTTVATNLAVALTRHAQQKTVLVDADDTFGDTAPTLALMPEGTVTDALRSLDRESGSDMESALSYHPSGLAVLPSPENPLEWRGITGDRMRQLFEHLARRFDVVLVDTGGSLSNVSLAALEAASLILWLTTPEYASVRDALQALQAVRAMPGMNERIRVILNVPSPDVEVRSSAIEEALARDVFWTIPYDRNLRRGAQVGRILVDDPRPKGPAARSLLDLGLALNGAPPNDHSAGLLQRLTNGRASGLLRRRGFDLKVQQKEVRA